MTIYGLVAAGHYIGMDGHNQMSSKKMFKSRAAAEAYKEDFKKRCIGTGSDLNDMDPEAPINIRVIEFELED